MNKKIVNEKLHNMYLDALNDLQFVSEVLLEDKGNNDPSVELLLTEALYSIACFSRAVRLTKNKATLQSKIDDLTEYLDQSIMLMSGDGLDRLKIFLSDYFNASRIQNKIALLYTQFESAAKSKKFHELIENDLVDDQVFDYFLYLDRFACLTYQEDCPISALADFLTKFRSGIEAALNKLKPVFSAYSNAIAAYKSNNFIPDEPAYHFWYEHKAVPVEKFIASFEYAAAAVNQKKVISLLVQGLPQQLSEMVNKLKLQDRITDIVNKLGQHGKQVFNQIGAFAQPPSIATQAAWGDAENQIELILSQHSGDLQKEAQRLSTELSGEEMKDVLIVEYLLAGDTDELEELLQNKI
jgi:hypothetical protein